MTVMLRSFSSMADKSGLLSAISADWWARKNMCPPAGAQEKKSGKSIKSDESAVQTLENPLNL